MARLSLLPDGGMGWNGLARATIEFRGEPPVLQRVRRPPFLSSGSLLGDVADPRINFRFDPDCALRPKRPRSRKPAVGHTLIDRRSLQADPGHDLGQAKQSSGGQRHGIVGVRKGSHRKILSLNTWIPSKMGCFSGPATWRCHGRGTHRYAWPVSSPPAATYRRPSGASRPRSFGRGCARDGQAKR